MKSFVACVYDSILFRTKEHRFPASGYEAAKNIIDDFLSRHPSQKLLSLEEEANES